MVIFTVLAYATQPLLGTIDFIQDIFDKSLSGWNSADAALGSAERLGMIVYAVNRTDILWHGAGIATHLWQEAYGLGFAHFGISDFGTFLCLGGVPFIVLMILFFITVYRRVFKDNAICYTFFSAYGHHINIHTAYDCAFAIVFVVFPCFYNSFRLLGIGGAK